MNELIIAQNLIDGYKNLKQQDNKTTALGSNIDRPKFKNCDLDLLKKILYKQGFETRFQKINNHNFLLIYPTT